MYWQATVDNAWGDIETQVCPLKKDSACSLPSKPISALLLDVHCLVADYMEQKHRPCRPKVNKFKHFWLEKVRLPPTHRQRLLASDVEVECFDDGRLVYINLECSKLYLKIDTNSDTHTVNL